MSFRGLLLQGLIFIFLATFAGQCGPQSGGGGTGNLDITDAAGGTEADTPNQAAAVAAQGMDGFEAMAKFYDKDVADLRRIAGEEGFDPSNFDPQSLTDLEIFLTFIHKAVPELLYPYKAYQYQSDAFNQSYQRALAEVAQPGFQLIQDPVHYQIFTAPLYAASKLVFQWRSEVFGLARLFGFDFPIPGPGESPPQSFTDQHDAYLALLEDMYYFTVFDNQAKSSFESNYAIMTLSTFFTLDQKLYQINLGDLTKTFEKASIIH